MSEPNDPKTPARPAPPHKQPVAGPAGAQPARTKAPPPPPGFSTRPPPPPAPPARPAQPPVPSAPAPVAQKPTVAPAPTRSGIAPPASAPSAPTASPVAAFPPVSSPPPPVPTTVNGSEQPPVAPARTDPPAPADSAPRPEAPTLVLKAEDPISRDLAFDAPTEDDLDDETPDEEGVERVGEGLILETPPRSLRRRLLIWGGGFSAMLALLAALGIAGLFAYYGQDPALPTFRGLEDYRPPLVTDIYSGDDNLIGEFYTERRRVIPYESIPRHVVQAFVAVEDGRFFSHFGIDLLGMVRAVLDRIFSGGQLRGASTLTQQTAKAILVSEWGFEEATKRTIRRKIIEMILAFQLESLFSKEEILGIYLNHAYLGHHSYGVQSAAENYFRKNASELTLGEAALLAGLPQAPSAYSPFVNPERAKSRRAHVLGRMYEEGMITESEREASAQEPIVAYPIEDVFRETTPFFTEHIRRYVVEHYGNDRLLHDGLEVYTTVDLEKQRYAQIAMIRGLSEVDKRQGFGGPLYRLPKREWDEFSGTYEDQVLRGKPLELLHTYVGLVTKVSKDEARVKVGNHEGLLPLIGMRWARKPNVTAYYPSSLIDDVRRALRTGDVVLVKRVKRGHYPGAKEPVYLRKVPKDARLLFTLEQEPELQGALVSMDPNSSYVVAMIGGLDFELSEFNRAFQACRQPGSAFKPIVYSAALEHLEWTPSTILIDAPIVHDDPVNQLRWKPNNYGKSFKGEIPLRIALVDSMNVPAVKVLEKVGVDFVVEWAHRLGIKNELNRDLSLALGSSCVSLWDLTNVYAVFNRYGKRVDPTFVRRVVDRDGNVLEDRTVYFDPYVPLSVRIEAGHARLYEEPEQLIPATTAYLTTYLLHHVVRYGTGIAATRLGKPAAGKTGTTNDSFDAWFMGFTRDLVTGVWIGYDTYDHAPMGLYENGGRAALPIWLNYMTRALHDREQAEFDPPPEIAGEIVFVDIDVETGMLADPAGVRPRVRMAYLRGTEPRDHVGVVKVEEGGAIDAMIQGDDL